MSPRAVEDAIQAGIKAESEDIFPDEMSKQLYAQWAVHQKGIERHIATDVMGYTTRMEPSYRITRARRQDLRLLPAIELAAAAMLVGHAPESVLREATSEQALREAQSQGLIWVALAGDSPVGFAHVELFEPGVAHLEELDVHPDHGRRGLGKRLVAAVCEWAENSGLDAVTLTTFRNAPWNMPFYATLGFEEIPCRELGPELVAVVQRETQRGLEPTRRVVMRRPSAAARPGNRVTPLARVASNE